MRCGEVMKRDVLFVSEDATVQMAAGRMRDANVGFLPVCDGARRVVGTVTDRDIAIRVDAEGRPASTCPVGEIMSRGVISCLPSDDLSRAEDLMCLHKKWRIPVTREDGVLEGVVSLSDVVQFEGVRKIVSTVREILARETRF